MTALLGLFGRSPFAPLELHMKKVSECVAHLPALFQAIEDGDFEKSKAIAKEISELEHQADVTKNDIRDHLPRTLFLPIPRSSILDILTLMDSIADRAEDVAVLATLKPLVILDSFKNELKEFIQLNIETYKSAKKVIKEMHELIESSFGGAEAEKVRRMVDDVAYNEHRTDLVQLKLLKCIIDAEKEMSYTTFFLWHKIFESLGDVSNLSENLAFRLRATLELK